ncbi:MAG: hypothetical protein V4622_00245 [Bacteroidota bacterium]
MKFTTLFLLIYSFSFSQKYKTFEGKLVYKVELSDSIYKKPIETKFTTIFTDDKMVRIESESNQLGSQILIKHLLLNKYYILLDINNQKFAIQQTVENDTIPSKYTFKKKFGSKKFDGKKAKKIRVNAKHFSSPIDMYYFKDLNPIFLDAMKGIPGLPAEYFLQTEDGVYHYTLINYLEEKTPKEIYEVSKEYKKVSFDEFMNFMMQGK